VLLEEPGAAAALRDPFGVVAEVAGQESAVAADQESVEAADQESVEAADQESVEAADQESVEAAVGMVFEEAGRSNAAAAAGG